MTNKRRELYIHILGENTLMKRFKLKHKVKGNILNATHPTIFWGWRWKERHTIASETFSFNRCEHRSKIKGIRNHVLEKKALSFVKERKCFLFQKKALITVSRLSGIFPRLFMRHTQFFKWVAHRKPYWKCLVKYSAHFVACCLRADVSYFLCCTQGNRRRLHAGNTFCGLFLLLNNAMQARFWSVCKVGEQVSIIFCSRGFLTKF